MNQLLSSLLSQKKNKIANHENTINFKAEKPMSDI